MTSIEEALRSGAVRLVPKDLTPKMQQDAAFNLSAEFGADFVKPLGEFARSAYAEFLAASPDHTPALLALIEERDRFRAERDGLAIELRDCRILSDGHRQNADEHRRDRLNAEARALAAEAKCDALREALDGVLAANDEFRQQMPDGWEGDPLQSACDRARALTKEAADV